MHLRILQMIVTSGFFTALECSKFVFGRSFTPDRAGGAYWAPSVSLTGLRRPYFYEKVEGRKGKGKKGNKREGGRPP